MNKQEQLEEIIQIVTNEGCDPIKTAKAIYAAGYRATNHFDIRPLQNKWIICEIQESASRLSALAEYIRIHCG